MNEEQELEMESWYTNNLNSKKIDIIMLGLMLLPFLAVLIKQQSSRARFSLLVFMGLNLLASIVF